MADPASRWNWVSIAAAILIACYVSFVIWALAAPSAYDPQQGMAIGFIIPVELVLGSLLLLLWRAVVRGRRWLVWMIFVLAAYPAMMLAAQLCTSISSALCYDGACGDKEQLAPDTPASAGPLKRLGW